MTIPPTGFIRLSSDRFSERDRLEATREVFGRAIMNVEFEPVPGVPFNMNIVLRTLPDFGLAAGTRSAMACIRTRQLIDSDDLLIACMRSGSGVFLYDGQETHIGTGGATVTRTASEGRLSLTATADMVTYRLPVSRIAPLIEDLDAAPVRPIPAESEPFRLLLNYSSILREEDALATPEIRSLVVTHLYDLAALVIGATRDATEAANGRGVQAARLRAIKVAILEKLADRELSIDAVALQFGVTPRYVSRLFESTATTFSEFVLEQRLLRAHRLLIDPRFSGRTVSSIAFEAGFGDISYFNRTFRRRFNATPSDLRATK